MTKKQVDYLSYLLRLWRVDGDEDGYAPIWRASLEDPQTGQQQGFASLEDLFDYLREKTGTFVHGAKSELPEEGGGE